MLCGQFGRVSVEGQQCSQMMRVLNNLKEVIITLKK